MHVPTFYILSLAIFMSDTTLAEVSPSKLHVAPRNLQGPSPLATTIATSRFTIDRFNLTFSLASDEPLTSIGGSDDYNDGLGSLKTTAVLFLTGSHPTISNPFIPTRVDFLLYKLARMSRDTITDFALTLFSDDGTPEHNPLAPVCSI